MTLDDYLRDQQISGADFAARLSISEASLSRIRRGEQNITRETIRQIVEETGGAVTAEALVFGHGADHAADATAASTGRPAELSGQSGAAA